MGRAAARRASRSPAPPTDLVDNLAALAVIVGTVLVLRGVGLWFTDGLAIVGGLAAAGLALVWGRAGGPDELMEGTSPLRIAVGVLLVATGFVAFVALTGDFATLGRSLLGALVAAAGLVLLLGPRLARLAGDLADERRARIRSEERAEIATHLHDGVLQTLALIQRRAGDEREVAALARRQERELREWLYGGGRPRSEGSSDAGLASELAFELGEVEDVHRVRVELVCVGDAPLDEGVAALVAAAREAATNAARHAGVEQVDVYVEVGDDVIEAFVRDRGTGFDPDAVPDDRRGLADSVIGRMQRAGGTRARARHARCRHRGDAAAPEAPAVTRRVFLVDDHALFRAGVRAELEGFHEVVGEAGDVEEAVARILATQPEVVLLDVHLPGGGGEQVPARLLPTHPELTFLALSVSDAPDDVIRVIRAGARGYVTKSITGDELADAVERVAAGDAVFSPRLAGFVLDAFAGAAVAPHDAELDQLTPRERDVLRLIARGYTYKEIARELFLSVKTIETHVSAVLRKLQLSNRHELGRWATDRRLL